MLHKVRILMTGPSRVEVFIDGEKFAGVKAVKFSASVEAVSQVELTFHAGEVEVDGIAEITAIGDSERRFEKKG
jgi:hypothetical protein